MTIGQALALMRSAEQFKDYQNRLNAQPTIDWRDVTQQAVGPQAPVYPEFQAREIVVRPDAMPEDYTQYESPVGPPDQYAVEEPIAGEPYQEEVSAPASSGPAPFDYSAILPELPSVMEGPVSARMRQPEVSDRQFLELYGSQDRGQPTSSMPAQSAMFADSYLMPNQDVAQGGYNLPPLPYPYGISPSRMAEIEAQASPMLAMAGETGRGKKKKKSEPKQEAVQPETPVGVMPEIPADTTSEIEPTLAITPELTQATPVYDTDVALREQMGQATMAQAPRPAEPIGVPKPPPWKPGESFSTKLTFGGKQWPATVTEFIPDDVDGEKMPARVTVDLGQGKTTTLRVQPNDPNYQTIASEYQGLVSKAGKTLEYPEKIRVGGEFMPAKYDPVTRQIKYLHTGFDPKGGVELVYDEKPLSKLTPEDFAVPIGKDGKPDTTKLDKIKRESGYAITPILSELPQLFKRWKGPDSIEDIRSRLDGKLKTSKEDIIGDIEWSYRIADENGATLQQVPLEAAVAQGIVPQFVADRLKNQWEETKKVYAGRLKAAKRAQGIEGPTSYTRNIEQIKKNIDNLSEYLKQIDADFADNKITAKQRDELKKETEKRINQERSDLVSAMSATPGIINTGAGTTGYESPAPVYGSSVDPTAPEGLASLLGGAPSTQSAAIKSDTIAPFDPQELVGNARDRALLGLETPSIIQVDPRFNTTKIAWSDRMFGIQDYLINYADEIGSSVDDLANRKAQFKHYTNPMSPETKITVMPFGKAVRKMMDTAKNYMTALASGNPVKIDKARNEYVETAAMFSGGIAISGVPLDRNYGTVDGRVFNPSRESRFLLQAPKFFAMEKQMDQTNIRPEEETPSYVERGAPQSTVTKQPSGSTKPKPQPMQAAPVYRLPSGKLMPGDGSYQVFEGLLSPNEYEFTGAMYSPASVNQTTKAAIARTFFNDNANDITSDQYKAIEDSVNKFNEKIISDSDEGRKLRASMLNMAVEGIRASGVPIKQGTTGLQGMFENIFIAANKGADDATLQGMVNEIIYGSNNYEGAMWSDKSNSKNLSQLNKDVSQDNAAGAQTTTLAENVQSYKGKITMQFKGTNIVSASKLIDNAFQSLYEMGALYAAAGRGAPEVKVNPKNNTYVTWIFNPLDDKKYLSYRSVITVPTAIEAKAGGLPPKLEELDNKSAKLDSSVDPAMGGAIVNVKNVLGSSGYSTVQKALRDVSAPIVSAAKRGYQEAAAPDEFGFRNLYGMNRQRSEDERFTEWGRSSDDFTHNNFSNNLMLGMYFWNNRHRDSWNASSQRFFPLMLPTKKP